MGCCIKGSKMSEEKMEKRNSKIITLRDKGWTFKKIADKVNLSEERVRQIYLG